MIRCLFIFWLSSCALFAVEEKPWSDAALKYVEHFLEAGPNEDILKDTAASPFISSQRKAEISDQWRGFYIHWHGRKPEIEVSSQKRDGELAAVVLKVQSGVNALRVQSIGLGLVLRNDQWLVCPSPGAFSNANLGYESGLLDRAQTLESWLSYERTKSTTRARDKADGVFMRQVAEEEKRGAINSPNAVVAMLRFFEACREGDLAALMAFQGGIDRPLPEKYSQILQTTSELVENPPKGSRWAMAADKQGITIPVKAYPEGDTVEIPIALWTPGEPRVHYEWIAMIKEEDNWRMDLPQSFSSTEYEPNFYSHEDVDDKEWSGDEFVAAFKKYMGQESCRTPEELGQTIVDILENGPFWKLGRTFELSISPDPATIKSFHRLQRLWKKMSFFETSRSLSLAGLYPQKNVLVLASLSFDRPRQEDLCVLEMRKSRGKYVLGSSVFADEGVLSEAERNMALEKAAEFLIEGMEVLGEWPEGSSPMEKEARECYESYRSAVEAYDVTKVLGFTHRLSGKGSAHAAFKALGHQLNQVESRQVIYEVVGYQSSGPYAGLSVRARTSEGVVLDDYLVCIIQTVPGPRILQDLDFRYAHTRGRKILNQKHWDIMNASGNAAAIHDLKILFDKHVATVETVTLTP